MDAGAKHDLQLAFGKLHANDTIQRLDGVLLDLAGILELKAQTGHAMPSVHNIVLAADILDDFATTSVFSIRESLLLRFPFSLIVFQSENPARAL